MSEQTADKSTITEQAAGGDVGSSESMWADAWKELRRNPWFIIAAFFAIIFIVMAVFPSLFASRDPGAAGCLLQNARQGPSREHWFGTDIQGCDYYTRVIYGARISMTVGVIVTAGAVAIALVLGLLAGYYGGFVDTMVSRGVDVVFAIPFLLGAIVFLNAIATNRGIFEVSLVLIVFGWPTMTRLMRSAVISVRSNEYVMAAKALGASDLTVMRRHILPNAMAPLVVYATVYVGIIIGAEATLTFLGVGMQTPSISWGLQLSAPPPGMIQQDPHLIIFPALFVGLAVFSFTVMGDALRDAMDPKRK